MAIVWLYSLASVIIVSAASLLGAFFLSLRENTLKEMVFVLVGLSVGALFGDVFIHIIPELFEGGAGLSSSLYILLGIFFFFVLEKFFRWRHVHGVDEETYHMFQEHKHIGYMNLVSDGVHNFIDGVFIGAAYLISVPIGVATTIAVVLHELPQEIGDFGILLHSGFTRERALMLNLLSGSFAIVGAIAALLFGQYVEGLINIVLAITAGTFIYIAGSDLVPELHRVSSPWKSFIQFLSILIGIILMLLLVFIE